MKEKCGKRVKPHEPRQQLHEIVFLHVRRVLGVVGRHFKLNLNFLAKLFTSLKIDSVVRKCFRPIWAFIDADRL